jgi:hypothetical protein
MKYQDVRTTGMRHSVKVKEVFTDFLDGKGSNSKLNNINVHYLLDTKLLESDKRKFNFALLNSNIRDVLIRKAHAG